MTRSPSRTALSRPTLSRAAALTALVPVSVIALAACSPDVTAGRVQTDVSTTFTHVYATTQQLQGTAGTAVDTHSSCARTGVHTSNSGAGGWTCKLTYTDSATGKQVTDKYGVGVDNSTCYTATNGALAQTPYITTSHGEQVTNPLYQFDGCFTPYGN